MTGSSAEKTCRQSIYSAHIRDINSFIIEGKTAVEWIWLPGNRIKILFYLEKGCTNLRDLSLIIYTHSHIDHYGMQRT
jgi:phosphoribosyl 1,2-cyclic phosphodiesterase